jgi:hypothetical protein
MKKLGEPETLEVYYEAGPTGYELYCWLHSMGISCTVVAPWLGKLSFERARHGVVFQEYLHVVF